MKTAVRLVLATGFVLGMGLMGAEGPWWGNVLGLGMFAGSVYAIHLMLE